MWIQLLTKDISVYFNYPSSAAHFPRFPKPQAPPNPLCEEDQLIQRGRSMTSSRDDPLEDMLVMPFQVRVLRALPSLGNNQFGLKDLAEVLVDSRVSTTTGL